MGRLYKQKGSNKWHLDYYRNGKRFRESSGTTKKTVALAMLKDREGRIARGEPVSLRAERVTFDELAEDFLNTYRMNSQKSLARAERSVRQLKRYFGGMRASQVTTAHVRSYITKRQGQKTQSGSPPANATVNRELAALKRIFNLARQSTPPRVYQTPHIPMLREHNVRTGFVEHEDFLALRAAVPDYLKPIITMAFYTGCRRGEILNLKWPQVDLNRRLIRLNPGETKNRDGRTVYMPEELYKTLAELWAYREWHNPGCEYVFTRNGKPIQTFTKAWQTACDEVGLGRKEEREDKRGKKRMVYEGLLFHDLRRSAIRNLIRAGVPQATAMRISGHKTASTFRRYDIVNESDLAQAAHALDKYHGTMDIVSDIVGDAERILEKVQKG